MEGWISASPSERSLKELISEITFVRDGSFQTKSKRRHNWTVMCELLTSTIFASALTQPKCAVKLNLESFGYEPTSTQDTKDNYAGFNVTCAQGQ